MIAVYRPIPGATLAPGTQPTSPFDCRICWIAGRAVTQVNLGHMRNLKLAFRTLLKTPFVTIVAVVSLALGIGANAAIYSLFNRILLQPLPVSQPERLVNFVGPG